MLLNNFYKAQQISSQSDNEIIAKIILNPEHDIYKGHFPNNPVVPGVISIQIVNEILSEHLEKKIMTSSAKSIKFPAMINPNVNPQLFVKIKYTKNEDNSYKVTAQIFFEDLIFLKFSGSFSIYLPQKA